MNAILDHMREENTNREPCLDCARKHVAKARAKLVEAPLGYPRHAWYAAGELAEAEDELVGRYPELAHLVREYRLVLMDSLDDATTRTPDGDLIINPDAINQPNWDELIDALIDAAIPAQ